MENTIENKKRFFAKYFGQKIMVLKGESLICDPNFAFMEGTYLQLKSISAISDEDAIEALMISLGEKKEDFEGEVVSVVEFYRECAYDDLNLTDGDFLRSRGHLVGWMGLTPEEIIEFGWAKI